MNQIVIGKQSKNVHHFTFSEKMSNMKIESATLYIYVRNTHHHGPADKKNSNFSIRIRELIQKKGESPVSVDIYGLFKPAGATSSLSHGRHNRSRWVQIDIRAALSKWVSASTSSRKITLVIEAVDNSGNPSKEVTVVNTSESDGHSSSSNADVNAQYPFIEVHVSESGRIRAPRNIGMTCDENSQETRCCKYPLTVDFEEFGWDWIIAPKQYYANYCSGECPFAFLQKYPHNHIVQQAVPSGVGGPCCAARKMSSISMLYFDGDSNIVYSVLPGMVVEKCGCS
ncbi:Growth/differentiation factor 8 [Orchesella cincta]|uniref:Growth/differentiation factor 8 n=1 Tax=Orchesella cincta TaxID=48709 RepID=A0A1D2MIS6_ORCCI|nr:Growth/differentiation factor 8 [Orchesella cincta]